MPGTAVLNLVGAYLDIVLNLVPPRTVCFAYQSHISFAGGSTSKFRNFSKFRELLNLIPGIRIIYYTMNSECIAVRDLIHIVFFKYSCVILNLVQGHRRYSSLP